MKMEIKFEEIVPVGNFDTVLKKFRELVDEVVEKCHKKKEYSSELAKIIKIIVGDFALIETLEEGISQQDVWDLREATICLLYAHLLIIDLNDTAQFYLNEIEMESPKEQLKGMIEESKSGSVYRNIELI
jgi:hypothetical protein